MTQAVWGRVIATVFALFAFSTILAAQTLGTVYFEFDSDQLDGETRAQVAEIAERLKASPSYKPTVVVGYTDAVGSASYNQGLGKRRARRVEAALVEAGVPVSRIGVVSSRGENDLVVEVATAERRNRRVRVTLEDMLAACRTYREIDLNPAGFGQEFQSDLRARLDEAVAAYAQFSSDGRNAAAFQMAGAARFDCGIATELDLQAGRKKEFGQKCFCNSARLRVALAAN